MGKPHAPTPPSPRETAAAQTATSVSTAIAQQRMGLVDHTTPYGSRTYQQTGSHSMYDPSSGKRYDIPTYHATDTLSAAQQRVKGQQDLAQYHMAKLGADQSARLGGLLDRPLDTKGLPASGDAGDLQTPDYQKTYGTDFSKDRQRVEDTLMQRMQPQLNRDREALDARLASQGIRMGSDAYSAAMHDYDKKVNDARMNAVLAGGQEQSRMVGMQAQRAAFGNRAKTQAYNASLARFNAQQGQHTQALQERLALRNQPLNELTALMSGSQVAMPQFMPPQAAHLPTTDYAGIAAQHYKTMSDRYKQQMGLRGSLFGGAADIGSALLSHPQALAYLSDRRLKQNIKRVGKTNDGQPIYAFRYKGGRGIHLGLMAQDVEKKKPEAVSTRPDGIKMVNYDMALKGAVR